MKVLIAIAIVSLSQAAYADSVAGGFMLDSIQPSAEPKQTLPRPQAIAPVQKPAAPVVRAKPVPAAPAPVAQTAPQAPTGQVPFQATLGAPDTTGCPEPVAAANARNTPVKVFVDQETQQVQIQSPDLEQNFQATVSTGGGLKIPNGKIKHAPYCARTPSVDRKIISAVTEDMFRGTTCTPDQIRAKSTVFPMYESATFTDAQGNPSPMKWAVRIKGGVFFHQVGDHYKELLGKNVSGECVRLPPKTAQFLQEQILKYGAIEVTISEPPVNSAVKCDEQMVADATAKMEQGQIQSAQITGTEGVYGGVASLSRILGRTYDPKKDAGLY